MGFLNGAENSMSETIPECHRSKQEIKLGNEIFNHYYFCFFFLIFPLQSSAGLSLKAEIVAGSNWQNCGLVHLF